ncbi:hypothetical protein AAFF_G00148680 [Aldrovandia affinis]|uniref:Uncharacterized protein n=1 Tax=Aldrovandia affinis TaxID=143900 RepID=A0AAD7RPG2_9TELE|nr:hypothetical protein AAFF_G00148680 [Aldrovandia affinis]
MRLGRQGNCTRRSEIQLSPTMGSARKRSGQAACEALWECGVVMEHCIVLNWDSWSQSCLLGYPLAQTAAGGTH